MNVLGRDPAKNCVFRAELSAGVWSVTRNQVFYGDYLTRAEALNGAFAAARHVEALGGIAEVRTGPHDTVQDHRVAKP